MSKILEMGRTPDEWSKRLEIRGFHLSPRTLRSRAKAHGQYFSIGSAMIITPDQMDEILLREASGQPAPVDLDLLASRRGTAK
jgi:hypothetical protein